MWECGPGDINTAEPAGGDHRCGKPASSIEERVGRGGRGRSLVQPGRRALLRHRQREPAAPPTPATAAQGASVLGVIDAFSNSLDQLVPTFNVPAVVAPEPDPHPGGTAHSVAANAENNLVFVALPANNVFPDCLTGCIAVYGRSDNDLDSSARTAYWHSRHCHDGRGASGAIARLRRCALVVLHRSCELPSGESLSGERQSTRGHYPCSVSRAGQVACGSV